MDCVNCKQQASHMHHVVPKSLGGNGGTNLVPLCETCHGKVHGVDFQNHGVLTKLGLKKAKERGTKLGGLRGGTEQRNEASKAIADNNAKRVSSVVVPLRKAGASLRAIADALNNANVPTPRGGSWGPSQVKYTLDRLGVNNG